WPVRPRPLPAWFSSERVTLHSGVSRRKSRSEAPPPLTPRDAATVPMNQKILFRTRIKFCGFTRAGDVRLACELGADAIGFVFAHGSKRRVAAEEARAMRQALAPMVDAVALFRDNTIDEVRDVVRKVRPSLLQFHGDEEDAF